MSELTIADLTVPSQHLQASEVLKEWSWLTGPDLDFVMITKLGDAFLIDSNSGYIYFLDTLDGEFETIASSVEKFKELLEDSEFVADYFSCNLLGSLLLTKMPENTVFNFKEPPVLGGQYNTESLELFDIQYHFDDLGKLWYELSQIELDVTEEPNKQDENTYAQNHAKADNSVKKESL